MSLDFVILGKDGKPAYSVGLSMNDFLLLARKASDINLNVFSQIDDYYSDFLIREADIEEFLKECLFLQHAGLDLENLEFLSKLVELCNIAKSTGAEIEILAD